MFQLDLPDPGPLPKWLVVIIVAVGQLRNIVLLAREARTWWRAPASTTPKRLPPPL
jgi:hypothetical protein